MCVLDFEEMESSSKIDMKDMSWWVSIKEAHTPRALVITRLSKEGCISLLAGGKPSQLHIGMAKASVAPFNLKTISSKMGLLKI